MYAGFGDIMIVQGILAIVSLYILYNSKFPSSNKKYLRVWVLLLILGLTAIPIAGLVINGVIVLGMSVIYLVQGLESDDEPAAIWSMGKYQTKIFNFLSKEI